MTSKKEESSRQETSEEQPKAPQGGELDEKQLDNVSGAGWPSYYYPPPATPGI